MFDLEHEDRARMESDVKRHRPLHSWPTWALRWTLRRSCLRALWTDAWIELWKREVFDVAVAVADTESGPWLVAPPPGMH